MTTANKKPWQAGNLRTASKQIYANHSITPAFLCWFASISTTASCVVSLAAPIVAALAGLIEGGAR